jgi:hypothetical protein
MEPGMPSFTIHLWKEKKSSCWYNEEGRGIGVGIIERGVGRIERGVGTNNWGCAVLTDLFSCEKNLTYKLSAL